MDKLDKISLKIRKAEQESRKLTQINTRKDINNLRTQSGKMLLANQRVADRCLQYLNRLGEFYIEDERLYYLFRGKVLLLSTSVNGVDAFAGIMMDWFRLAIDDTNYRRIYQQLYQVAKAKAKPTMINLLSYFNEKTKTLYVSDHNRHMFVLDGEKIKIEENGYDNIIFYTPLHFSPIKLAKGNTKGTLDKYFFEAIWFDGEEKEQQALLREWFFSLFFHNIQQEKPLLIIKGDRGSGKTATIRCIGILLQGRGFMGVSMTNSHTDFIMNLYHNFLLLVDNVDERIPAWFPDVISSITTGAGISVRRLYRSVDAEPIRFKPKTYIGLTTRTPEFNRDDITSRGIICSLAAKANYGQPIYKIIEKKRQQLWSDILNQLNERIKNLGEDNTPYYTDFRMGELTNLAVRSNNDKDKEFIWELFNKIPEAQGQLNVEGNPAFELLSEFVASGDCYKQKEWTASELFHFFRRSSNYNSTFRNVIWLGRGINRIATNLHQFFPFKKRVVKGVAQYQFGEAKKHESAKKERENTGQMQADIMES